MTNSYLRLLVISLVIIALQVWVFSPIAFARVATPVVYPVLLMFLPMDRQPIRLTLYGLLVGALIDYLGFTPGLHGALFSLLGFIRHYLVRLITNAQDDMEYLPLPSVIEKRAYILLAELFFIHHILLYTLMAGLHADWGYTWLRMGAGYVLSYLVGVLIMLSLSLPLKPMSNHGK